jgi:Zn-dependent protease
MGQSFSLGRISGIRIGVNWSVLLIVALLAYGLAAGQFPADVPHRPEAEYVAATIVTAVAYMASLLAHELAHSLVARRNGVQVEGSRCGCSAGCRGCRASSRVRAPNCAWPGSGR